jgi:hypothetical protein
MHDFPLPPTHAFLGICGEIRGIYFKPKSLQIQSEAHVTYGNARRQATIFFSRGHLQFPLHGCRLTGKNLIKKRSQRGIILGVSEEVKGFRDYLMDDKMVVNTQHVKYIETLSRIQNLSLLNQSNSSVDDT